MVEPIPTTKINNNNNNNNNKTKTTITTFNGSCEVHVELLRGVVGDVTQERGLRMPAGPLHGPRKDPLCACAFISFLLQICHSLVLL